MSVMYKKGYTS